jgi:DNA polymerase-3 subunit gamma/tau
MGDKKKQAGDRRVALYRKYRSKSLSEIIGQDHITKTLSNAIKNNRISHAYLFTGPRGTGKTSIARILAHEINKIPYNDESTHLDIIEIDAASNRRIDDIRDLREKVKIAPLSVEYKVYIIDEVHMLTNESFNALLKTLEEPPAHVIFILATTEVHKLPATIISRTQRHSFKSVPTEMLSRHLKNIAEAEGIKITDEALNLLATHGNGSVRDSISLLDQLSNQISEVDEKTVELLVGAAPKKQLSDLLTAVNSGNYSEVLKLTSNLIESGINPSGIANQLALVIRDNAKRDSVDNSQIDLLYNLLLVHGSTFPQLTLESTLLKAANQNSDSLTVVATDTKHIKTAQAKAEPIKASTVAAEISPQKELKSKVTKGPKDVPNAETRHAKSKEIPADFKIEDSWQEILDEIKTQNNSLYTVLRLAKYQIKGDTLLLEFNFPFHKKRVDDFKNMNTLSQVISKTTGLELGIEAVVNKTADVSTESGSDTKKDQSEDAHASVIDNVRDIMGGGEIVDV